MGTGGPLPGSKAQPRYDADHSSHLVPRSWMRSYTSSSPCRLHGGNGTAFTLLSSSLFAVFFSLSHCVPVVDGGDPDCEHTRFWTCSPETVYSSFIPFSQAQNGIIGSSTRIYATECCFEAEQPNHVAETSATTETPRSTDLYERKGGLEKPLSWMFRIEGTWSQIS
jgi:hypothetical protein